MLQITDKKSSELVDMSTNNIPRLLIAGLSGGSGKTLISLALAHAWTQKNINVIPYKKGPDYIDAAWLRLATQNPCYCLDPFFLNSRELNNHFINTFKKECIKEPREEKTFKKNCWEHFPHNIALIEGNRGLFDGKDVEGTCSSAYLAKTLDTPVIVSINCTKMTRTVAALVMGLSHFDPSLHLAGVILNNTGTERHAKLVQKAVEMYTDVPVLGVLPRIKENPIPERHMGLQFVEKIKQKKILTSLVAFIEDHINVPKLAEIIQNKQALPFISENTSEKTDILSQNPKIEDIQTEKPENLKTTIYIAYIHDDALWFYYQENLDALKEEGATLIPLSILNPTPFAKQATSFILKEKLPKTKEPFSALYIGGGYPELFADEISRSHHMQELKSLASNNLPIYAECGGFMILTKKLHIENKNHSQIFPMANIFNIETKLFDKPQSLGYVSPKALYKNPYHPVGEVWHGHEFHFSKCIGQDEKSYIFEMQNKLNNSKTIESQQSQKNTPVHTTDGLLYKQCFACYTHLFAPATPHWAKNFFEAAKIYASQKNN